MIYKEDVALFSCHANASSGHQVNSRKMPSNSCRQLLPGISTTNSSDDYTVVDIQSGTLEKEILNEAYILWGFIEQNNSLDKGEIYSNLSFRDNLCICLSPVLVVLTLVLVLVTPIIRG